MPEMLGYICGSMESTTKAVRAVNRRLGILTVMLTVYIVVQEKRIKKLNDDLKEMKREGE